MTFEYQDHIMRAENAEQSAFEARGYTDADIAYEQAKFEADLDSATLASAIDGPLAAFPTEEFCECRARIVVRWYLGIAVRTCQFCDNLPTDPAA